MDEEEVVKHQGESLLAELPFMVDLLKGEKIFPDFVNAGFSGYEVWFWRSLYFNRFLYGMSIVLRCFFIINTKC